MGSDGGSIDVMDGEDVFGGDVGGIDGNDDVGDGGVTSEDIGNNLNCLEFIDDCFVVFSEHVGIFDFVNECIVFYGGNLEFLV